ncbi:DUF1016 N-terminal domain-containing protein [Anaerobacterium chartisolvens]|uniref:DUF1016 N-terminal domain-containing protein n=1 Tax=Anaerobacterium chartisolvens TaxID=1297424 RepID=UPI0014757D99
MRFGKIIKQEIVKQDRAEYGKQIIDYVSKQLTLEYGRDFSRSSLFRMIQFFEYYPDNEIVASLMRQLLWTHFVELIKIKDPLKRDFYTKMCVSERWSVRTLKGRIDSVDPLPYLKTTRLRGCFKASMSFCFRVET